jgi:hypothetical protein
MQSESTGYRVPGLIRLVARRLSAEDEPDPLPPGGVAA